MNPEEQAQAKLNQARVKEGYGNEFYAQQAHAVAQWGLGETKPREVIVGELPYVGEIGRERREDNDN